MSAVLIPDFETYCEVVSTTLVRFRRFDFDRVAARAAFDAGQSAMVFCRAMIAREIP